MRVRRSISSIPFRSAGETWQVIIDLVTGAGSRDVRQLEDAVGVIGSIITDEHAAEQPIVIEGVGPQLRIYCKYGMKAIEESGGLDSLGWNPTAGDWTMHLPCDKENIGWVRPALAKTSPRIRVYDLAETAHTDEPRESTTEEKRRKLVIDWDFKG